MNKDVSKEVSFEPMEGYRYREGGGEGVSGKWIKLWFESGERKK